ncbi:hypothetical protein [uncultured Lacinutrix sp.]|uniref:hypothetical protein n=1 Tax=uncultured Lacinutrix sp. TaxID=574032 RepID=UPI002621FB1F|nr:hypothetical protein [uncultured Lacinutrix sp.]
MKQKLKRYLKFGIFLFGIALIFTHCKKEDDSIIDESQLQQIEPKVVSQKIAFDNSLHRNTLNKTIGKLKSKLNSDNQFNRDNEDDNIIILTDEVLYTTYSETHTYTFKLLRINPEFYIENVVLHYNVETESYDEYLIQYDITPEEYLNIDNGGFLENSDRVTITDLENGFVSSYLNRGCNRVCQTIYVECSSPAKHTLGQTCTAETPPYSYQSCSTVCFDISAPDGPSGGGGSNGGDSGSDNDNPIDTDVVTDPMSSSCKMSGGGTGAIDANGDCVALGLGHVASLNKLTEQSQIQDKIAELKTKTSEDREYGYQFKLSGSNPITYNIVEATLDTDSRGVRFDFPSHLTRLEVHTHYAGLDSAFSSEDLFNTVRSAVNANNNDQHTSILVAPNGKLFALRVNNMENAGSFADNYVDSNGNADKDKFETMQKFYIKYVVNKANEDCNNTCTDAEYDAFLNNHLAKILITFSTGLSLYEATEDADGNITWSPIVYTP